MIDDISRQSFLGEESEELLASCKVAIIGVSGGGSHIAQQLAHAGVGNYVLIDPKQMAKKHLHRMVGATAEDVELQIPKVEIAERLIRATRPDAQLKTFKARWQEKQLYLRDSTAVFGCVDSYSEREQLERFCRRFLIPYIDVGMDVFAIEGSYHISGQTVLSSAGHPCLRCMGIVTERRLGQEAAEYGAAGPKAQVVWSNGVLASTAVGLFVQLVCPWFELSSASAYLEYNGNTPSLAPSPRIEFAAATSCLHYSTNDVGDPFFQLNKLQINE